ncbi:MAG: coproporphyrinogen-III oxidase family protein [Anaerolineae bacterium]
MTAVGQQLVRLATRALRRRLCVDQRWVFERPASGWTPAPVESTSLYLHVPFCRNACPYCPYTKVPYDSALVEPYTRAALAEVDWWADRIGPAEITSVYIGGGTPTLALASVRRVIDRVRQRFRVTGDICIETSPTDVNEATVRQLHELGIALVSLGVQSFKPERLAWIGRRYGPDVAERALRLLAQGGFASVNVDLMFALPGQSVCEVLSDLERAAELGANQITTYPLFTFPYSAVGEHLRLTHVRLPNLRRRRAHYRAINDWCAAHGFERVSVWGFRRGAVPRYSSVTRDSYIGVGPGAGSHLADGFVLNTFDLDQWVQAACAGTGAVALRLPFTRALSGWWWLYWRLYDTRIPLAGLAAALGDDAPRARRLLQLAQLLGLAARDADHIALTDAGAFWLHLAQNYFALYYVNTLWTQARREPWPRAVAI